MMLLRHDNVEHIMSLPRFARYFVIGNYGFRFGVKREKKVISFSLSLSRLSF